MWVLIQSHHLHIVVFERERIVHEIIQFHSANAILVLSGQLCVYTHSRNKHEDKDHGGSQQKAYTHDRWIFIDVVHESVC